MIKIASVVLASSLGLAGLAQSTPAEAHPYLSVGVGLPVISPVEISPVYYAPRHYGPAYYGAGYWSYSPYWRPGYVRYGHERFYRHWYRR